MNRQARRLAGLWVGVGLASAAVASATPYESGGKVDAYFGAYTEEVPIVVPAYHGLEPKLSLAYNSAAGNGIAGVGWSLRGLSVIEMTSIGSGATAELTYALDGEPLVPCDRQTDRDMWMMPRSPSCEPGAVPEPDTGIYTGYATLSESYLKIQHFTSIIPGVDHWTVWLKNGTRLTYQPSDAWTYNGARVKYVLTSATDTSDEENTVHYDWNTRAAGHAFTHLAAIRYNGTRVELHYAPRVLNETYAGGLGLDTIDLQLVTIDVCIHDPSSTAPCAPSDPGRARAYSLDYKVSAGTSRPLLTGITTWGANAVLDTAGKVTSGHALPPMTFTWNDAAPTFDTVQIAEILDWGLDSGRAMVDWNGDGNVDLCRSVSGQLACAFGNGAGWGLATGSQTVVGSINGWGDNDTRSYVDWDGDGKTDFCRTGGGGIYCASSTGMGLVDAQVMSTSGIGALADAGVATERWFTDWNGDGRTDFCRLVHANQFTFEMWCAFSRGRGLYADHKVGTLAVVNNTLGHVATRAMTDWNGDGKADFCRVSDSTIRCLMAVADPFDRTNLAPLAKDFAIGSSLGQNIGYPDFIQWIDVNGDGKSDYCRNVGAGELHCALSAGLGHHDVVWATGDFSVAASRRWGDMNGDGKMDLCGGQGAALTCRTSKGLTSVVAGTATAASWTPKHWMVDWNGDGRAEYCMNTGSFNGNGSFLTCLRRRPTDLGDLITTFANGLGSTTTVTYAPSSRWTAFTVPPNNNPPVMPTVASVVTDGGPATTYLYAGGQYDAFSRRFLGFGWVRITDPCLPGETACPFTEMTYRIDPRYPTRPSGAFRYGGNHADLMQQTLYTYADTATTPYRSDPTAENVFVFEGGGSDQLAVTRTYDRYGNVIRLADAGLASSADDDRNVDTEFWPNLERYIVDKPGRLVGWSGTGANVVKLTETQFHYDEALSYFEAPLRGQPTLTRVWLDTNNSYLESTAVYDGYGNVVSETDPRGNLTTTVVDDTYHQYVVQLVLPAPTPGATPPSKSMPLADWNLPCGARELETDDRTGATTVHTYDPLCRRTRTDLPGGGYERISYNHLGITGLQHTEVASPGPDGDVWARTFFDGRGRTTKLTRRGPSASDDIITAEYTYNARGKLATRTRPRYALDPPVGAIFQYGYDLRDRVVRQVVPGGAVKATSYRLRTTTETDELGHQQMTEVDARGRMSWTASAINGQPQSDMVHYTYDGRGNLETIRQLGQLGTVWSTWYFTYDSLGRKIAMTDPDAGQRYWGYDAAGNLVDEIDGNGSLTRTTYDGLDRRTSRTINVCSRLRCFGGPRPTTVTWRYDEARPGYVNAGQLTSMTDAAGVARFDHDAAGNLVSGGRTVDGVDHPFAKQYDLGGRVLATTYPDGSTVGTATQPLTYDASGRLTSIPGFIESASYDAEGQLTGYQATTAAVTNFDHDPVTGRLSGYRTVGPATTNIGTMVLGPFARSGTNNDQQNFEVLPISTSFALTAGQTLTVSTCDVDVTGARGSGDTFLRLFSAAGIEVASNDNADSECDGLSTLHFTVPSGGGTYTVRAGCAGPTSCEGTVAVAIKNPMTNLALGRPVTMSSELDPGCGPSSAAVDGNTSGEWCSGSSMAHSELEDQPWLSVDLGTNGLDKIVDHIDLWNRRDRACDAACRDRFRNFDVYVHDAVSGTTRNFYIHDPVGYPTRIDVGGPATHVTIRLRDTQYLNVPEVQVFGSQALLVWSTPVLHAVSLTRDAEGRIETVRSNRPDESWTYTYSTNARHQLAGAVDDYDGNDTEWYAYDPNGNMIVGPAGTYGYPTGPNPARPHAVTTLGHEAVTYDNAGQQRTIGSSITMGWDGAGRLASVSGPAGTVSYVYDANGERLAKTFQGVTTVYLGEDYEVTAGISTVYVSLGGRLVAKRSGGVTTWLHTNHQGSVVLGLDAIGNEVMSASYDPYGNEIASTARDAHGYTGQRLDESGTLYLHGRMIAPRTGRFMSPDPTLPSPRSVGLNRYAYALNDPINRTDIDGMGFWEDVNGSFIQSSNEAIKVLGAVPGIGGALALPVSTFNGLARGDEVVFAKGLATQAIIGAAIATSIVTYGYAAAPAIAVASAFVTAFAVTLVNTGDVERAAREGGKSAAIAMAMGLAGELVGGIAGVAGATAAAPTTAAAQAAARASIFAPIGRVISHGVQFAMEHKTQLRILGTVVGGMTGAEPATVLDSRIQAVGASTMSRLSSGSGALYGYGYRRSQDNPHDE